MTQWLPRWLLVLTLLAANLAPARADFTFAALGDTPYTVDEEARFIAMIAEINREPLPFVIHVGDFKNGWSPCSDALFEQRHSWFALFHHALIYTPGDNEWTDCWRPIGASHDPVERLQKLRRLFFADRLSLGQRPLALTRQSAAYPENARWVHEHLVFATLNVPGSNNNLRMPEESVAREATNQQWLKAAFEFARTNGHPAVVLAMQANPFVGTTATKNGYAPLLKALARESADFGGEVLLIHGDTHRYRIDQPLADPRTKRTLRNFTRIEVFGYPYSNWVRVHVGQRDGRITFAASPGS